MFCLEVITLRIACPAAALQEMDKLRELLAGEARGENRIFLFRNPVLESDISIHICHDNDECFPEKSPLGIRLARALGRRGLVWHTLWVREEFDGVDRQDPQHI